MEISTTRGAVREDDDREALLSQGQSANVMPTCGDERHFDDWLGLVWSMRLSYRIRQWVGRSNYPGRKTACLAGSLDAMGMRIRLLNAGSFYIFSMYNVIIITHRPRLILSGQLGHIWSVWNSLRHIWAQSTWRSLCAFDPISFVLITSNNGTVSFTSLLALTSRLSCYVCRDASLVTKLECAYVNLSRLLCTRWQYYDPP